MRQYYSLLKKYPDYRRLFYAQITSLLGDWFNTIALMTIVYKTTSSAWFVSLILLAQAVPSLILSPLVGAWVDRWDRKKIMFWSDMGRAFFVIFFIWGQGHFWFIFLIKFVLSITGAFFAPARQAKISDLVAPEDRLLANSLSSMAWGTMAMVGAATGGVLSAYLSYEWAFTLNSLSFLISAIFIAQMQETVRSSISAPKISRHELLAGFHFIKSNPTVLAIVIVAISWGFVGGAYSVLLIVYAYDVFQVGEQGLGILYAVEGLGILIGGSFAYYIQQKQIDLKKAFGWAYFGQSVFFLFFSQSNEFFLGATCLLLMYSLGGIIIPLDTTLIQEYTPTHLQGRVFALHMSTYGVFMQVSIFVTGLLAEYYSPQKIGLCFGVIALGTTFFWFYQTRERTNEKDVS